MKPRYISDTVLIIDTRIFFLILIHPTIEYLQLHLYVHHLLCYHLGQSPVSVTSDRRYQLGS